MDCRTDDQKKDIRSQATCDSLGTTTMEMALHELPVAQQDPVVKVRFFGTHIDRGGALAVSISLATVPVEFMERKKDNSVELMWLDGLRHPKIGTLCLPINKTHVMQPPYTGKRLRIWQQQDPWNRDHVCSRDFWHWFEANNVYYSGAQDSCDLHDLVLYGGDYAALGDTGPLRNLNTTARTAHAQQTCFSVKPSLPPSGNSIAGGEAGAGTGGIAGSPLAGSLQAGITKSCMSQSGPTNAPLQPLQPPNQVSSTSIPSTSAAAPAVASSSPSSQFASGTRKWIAELRGSANMTLPESEDNDSSLYQVRSMWLLTLDIPTTSNKIKIIDVLFHAAPFGQHYSSPRRPDSCRSSIRGGSSCVLPDSNTHRRYSQKVTF